MPLDDPSQAAADHAARELRQAGVVDVRSDPVSRRTHAYDASLYRVPPVVVARPRDGDEVAAAIAVAREQGLSVTPRGGGTSVAGNAVGPGVLLDLSRHLHRVLDVDPDAMTARVEAGATAAAVDRAAARWGLTFGPDPSTRSRCTIGGMLGNNACGARTLERGRTVDNLVAVDVLTSDSTRLRATTALVGPPRLDGDDALVERLRAFAQRHLGMIRTELGRFDRQMSGYALEHLLPERGLDVGRLLVGSEGTLGVVTEATVRLVRLAPARVVLVLGFPDMPAAGRAAAHARTHGPSACEGLDSRIVDALARRRGATAVPRLPSGDAWLFVELSGSDVADLQSRAAALAEELGNPPARVVTAPAEMAALWRVREDGAGLSGRSPAGRPAWSGWEDSAVPPETVGDYLRDLDALMGTHALTGMPFGHLADGCVHIRLDFPLADTSGAVRYRAFVEEAAGLVASYGGSLSGEHGDGRARSELLGRMYSGDALGAFAELKRLFDPGGLLNPGVVVEPDSVDVHLRLTPPADLGTLALAFAEDDGDFHRAVHRCTGVAKCRAPASADAVMCPSYLATGEEKDSTRGRARVLQDLASGRLDRSWQAPEIHEVLDLCLACKACSTECPAGVDMASYKVEALSQRYRRRLRPRNHYSLGLLPVWAAAGSRMPGVVNATTRAPGLRRLVAALAGIDGDRRLPELAPETFRSWWRREGRRLLPAQGREVVLFIDTFTDRFTPQVGRAAVQVLGEAGYLPVVPGVGGCCGLTRLSTGQTTGARRSLTRLLDGFDATSTDAWIVGLEPSCTAVLRGDAERLVPAARAASVAARTRTLAELLNATPGWRPPDLGDLELVAQPHCHHQAVMGWQADADLLDRAGAQVTRVGGCCGLAGNFGVERGHAEISRAVAETQLLPALRERPDGDVLADGFSCRTQVSDLDGRRSLHLAELLADN